MENHCLFAEEVSQRNSAKNLPHRGILGAHQTWWILLSTSIRSCLFPFLHHTLAFKCLFSKLSVCRTGALSRWNIKNWMFLAQPQSKANELLCPRLVFLETKYLFYYLLMLLIAIWGFGGAGQQAALLDVEPFWDKWALRSKAFAVAALEYVLHFAVCAAFLQWHPVLSISLQRERCWCSAHFFLGNHKMQLPLFKSLNLKTLTQELRYGPCSNACMLIFLNQNQILLPPSCSHTSHPSNHTEGGGCDGGSS